jgi:hypothetical protein
MTATRTIAEITAELKKATADRAQYRALHNEGQGGYANDKKIEQLSAELTAAEKAQSPLATREGIEAARAWAKTQNWTAKDMQSANNACLARGYSLAELQAAIKTI